MNIHANVTIKNERLILQEVMPYWKNYSIDKWIIYDDNSTDGSVEFIKQ